MRQIIIILGYMLLLNIPLTIKAAMKRITQKATQPISQTLLHQTRKLATTRTHRFVQLPNITKMQQKHHDALSSLWQGNAPTTQTPLHNSELPFDPTIHARQIASELPLNPLTLYSQILEYEQKQPKDLMLRTKHLQHTYEKFNDAPTQTNAFEFLEECLNNFPRFDDKDSWKNPKPNTELTKFYHEFTSWTQQQSPKIIKLLDPFIKQYENAYKTRMEDVHNTNHHQLEQLQSFFNHILHPDQSKLNILAIVQNIKQTHNKLLHLVTTLSKDQKKMIDPLLNVYQLNYDNYIANPNNNIRYLIATQIILAHRIQLNNPQSRKLTHYNTTLQSLAQNIRYTGDLNKIDRFKKFIETIDTLKPELLALEHISHKHAPGDPLIPLTSYNLATIGEDIAAFHDADNLHIQVDQPFHDATPSEQHSILLHEARHHFQTKAGALKDHELTLKFYSPQVQAEAEKQARMTWLPSNDHTIWKAYEYDADHFATSNITCPTCLKVIQSNCKTHKDPQGYFSQQDIEPFIQAAKNNPCCPAHSIVPGDDAHNNIVNTLNRTLALYRHNQTPLNNFSTIPEDLKSSIKNLDKQSGTLLQHIPEYNQNLIARIRQNKETKARIAAATLKETDIRKTMEQTERDIRAGKYKQLEAPKPLIEYPK